MAHGKKNEFDPTSLGDAELLILRECRKLAAVSGLSSDSMIAKAHQAMINNDVHLAINCFQKYMAENSLDILKLPEINGRRLGLLRAESGIKAKEIAEALNVSSAAISQLEKGNRKAIGFIKALVAAELIGISPASIFVRDISS